MPVKVRTALVALAVVVSAALSLRTTDQGRAAERAVGEHLATLLGPGEEVAGDMTRVLWFAGRRPLPPRHFGAEELVARARAPGVRFVVLGTRRDAAAAAAAALAAETVAVTLPQALARAAAQRGMAVLERR